MDRYSTYAAGKEILLRKILAATLLGLALAALSASAQTCEEQCTNDRYACDAGCTTYWCYDECDQAYNGCVINCQPCQPSTRDYSTYTINSYTFTGQIRCLEEYLGARRGYRFYEYLYKYTTKNYRETTQCDGTKTTVLLSTSTGQGFCWEKSPYAGDSCSPYSSRAGYGFCS